MQISHGFVFDQFHLDLHDERLWHGHQVVHLHPKTFAVLCLFGAAGGPSRDQRGPAGGGLA